MTERNESITETLGVTDGDLASMKRLRRRHAIGRVLLSSSVGFAAGFLPTAAIVLDDSSQSSSYPYLTAAIAGGIQRKDGGRSSRVLYLFSIPFLLLGILAGLTLAISSTATVTYYGVLNHR